MIAVRRRLFWKIYATLLSSLVAVAILMGCMWWLLAEVSGERWGGALRIDLKGALARSGASPGIVADVVPGSGGGGETDVRSTIRAAPWPPRTAIDSADGGR